jgi:hypothetical protein
MPRMSLDAKRETLLKKAEQLQNQIKTLDARKKDTDRKRDTRRKIIAGALALEHFDKHPNDAFSKQLRTLMREFIDQRDRHLFPALEAGELHAAE